MAMVTCKECGNEISDLAGTCPHCGYPIQAVRNAQIDRQNRAYYQKLNEKRLILNSSAFVFAGFLGYMGFYDDFHIWALVVAGICVLIMFILSIGWVTTYLALKSVSQEYKHISKYTVILTSAFGFLLGAIIGCFT